MNTKILMSLVMIGVASAGVGYGTFAFFTDTASSTSNLFSAGTVALTIGDADQGPTEIVTASFGNGNFAPGDSVNGNLTLFSAGTSLSGLVLDIKGTDIVSDATAGMDKALLITNFLYGGAPVTPTATQMGLDGDATSFSVYDLAHSVITLSPQPAITGTPLSLTVTFDGVKATNAMQGDSVTLALEFQLRQTGAPALTPAA